MPYRIAIVDDRLQNRRSLTETINYAGDVDVRFIASNGREYLETLKNLAHDQHPEIVLMDIDMPVMNGIDAVRNGTALYPHIRYIMLTVFDDDDKLFDAIQAGASGYLLKEENVDVILSSIKEVMEKEGAPMSPRIARKALNLLLNPASKEADRTPAAEACMLSSRETDILQELVNGLDYKQIATRLFISPHTVRKHIANIYEKLQVSSRSQAVKLAIRNKWA